MDDIGKALRQVLGEVRGVLEGVESESAGRLVDALLAARGIYVAGEGRSGLVARTFAMRLVHLGMRAYVCGETITPAIQAGDLCVACSGSGETPITCHRAEQSRRVGAQVAAVVGAAGTHLGRLANVEVVLPAAGGSPSRQFGASLFEQALLLFLDSVVLVLQARRGTSAESMRAQHANLE